MIFTHITSEDLHCGNAKTQCEKCLIHGCRDHIFKPCLCNLLLPVGSLIYLLFSVTKWGWGFDKYIDEANTGEGLKISKKLKPYFQFILPLLILFILIQGLV